MRWINASERLPDEDYEAAHGNSIFIRCKGMFVGYMQRIGKERVLKVHGFFDDNPMDVLEHIQWLDETEQPSHISGQGEPTDDEILQAKKQFGNRLNTTEVKRMRSEIGFEKGAEFVIQWLKSQTASPSREAELEKCLGDCVAFIEELKSHGISNWSGEAKAKSLLNPDK